MKLCFIADPNHVNTRNWLDYFSGPLGHEIHLVCLNKVTCQYNKVILHEIQVPCGRRKIRYLWGIPSVQKAVKAINPDLLVGYRITSYGFMAAATGFHPLVLVAQGQNIVYPSGSVVRRVAARFALKRADLINAWAPHMEEKMVRLGADRNRILTLPRGVDTRVFKPAENGSNQGGFRIISTRSLRPEPVYSIEPIIGAVRILKPLIPEIEYVVVGDGERKKAMMDVVSRLNLQKNVLFLGTLPNRELPNILHRCQIYVSNVRTDGVSASLIEAMSCGLFPVVVNNVSNRDWIVNNVNGFLVAPDSPEDMAKAIRRACEDSELRKLAAKMNRKIILERAVWHVNMSKIESAYKDLIGCTR